MALESRTMPTSPRPVGDPEILLDKSVVGLEPGAMLIGLHRFARIRPDRRIGRWAVLAILALVAIATRFQQFGNPILHIDEQFYLLVGDRMLSGAIPYVDIWDRKPVGLFLIYAAIRCLGGTGIIQYQLVATAFAIATAYVVERIAARLVDSRASIVAGILYLLWIPLLTGQGGQSPVFYNLFMALAAYAVVAAGTVRTRGAIVGYGAAAMGLTGLALQIKYSVLFEGVFFGVVLSWVALRAGMRAALLPLMASWVALALAPTLAAAAAYWAMGHFRVYWFSNFVSIFHRRSLDGSDAVHNAASLSLYLAPLIVTAVAGVKLRRAAGPASFAAMFVAGWLACAIVSVIVFGYYFDHYGLPIVVPATVSAATALGDPRWRRWTIALLAGTSLACAILPTINKWRRGTPAQFDAVADVVRPYAGHGLFVWDNLFSLYTVLKAPLPGRYPFPSHLRDRNEDGAIGVSRPREVIRILDTRPAVIVIEQRKARAMSRLTTVLITRRLTRDYHRIASIRVGRNDHLVFLRNDEPVR